MSLIQLLEDNGALWLDGGLPLDTEDEPRYCAYVRMPDGTLLYVQAHEIAADKEDEATTGLNDYQLKRRE